MKIPTLFLVTAFLVTRASGGLFGKLPVGEIPVGEIPVVENVGKEDGGLLTMDGRDIDGFMDPNHAMPIEDLEELVAEILEVGEAPPGVGDEHEIEVLEKEILELERE